jgi:ATP-dependent DNA helicase RecG
MADILEGKAPSFPRNKQIASLFKKARLIEKYGTGIKRVRSLMSDLGAKEPVLEIMGNMFNVTLFPISVGGVNEVFEYISENPGKNATELSQALGTRLRTVE